MKYLHTTLFFLFTILLFSCNNRKDRTEDLKIIDQKITEVNDAENVFQSIDFEHTKENYTKIMDAFKYIQKNYQDTMPKEEALFWTKYKNVAKMVKNLDQKKKTIALEIPRTRQQLNNLKKAITSKATEDKTGKKIDDLYLDKALKEELLYAKQLISQISDLKLGSDLMKEKFPQMKPQADNYLSTLQLKMSKK